MEYTTLGRTGLRASVLGLGSGGPSRLGCNTHGERATSLRVVGQALDLGVNYFDTAESYGTEELLGEGLASVPRESVVVATKKSTWGPGHPPLPEEEIVAALDESLRRLRTPYVDVYQLHAVLPDVYEQVRDHVVPILDKLRDRGKVRHFGISEMFNADPGHRMLARAVQDDCWDTVMVGYNLLNPSAAERVLSVTRGKGIGVQVMFAVRRALSRPERLAEVLADLRGRGLVPPDVEPAPDALDFLLAEGGASSLPDAAYRFCRHTPGCDVILSGTGDPAHLRQNARSMLSPPLSPESLQRLHELFGEVDCLSGS